MSFRASVSDGDGCSETFEAVFFVPIAPEGSMVLSGTGDCSDISVLGTTVRLWVWWNFTEGPW